MSTDRSAATPARVALVLRRPDGSVRTLEADATSVHLGRWTTLPSAEVHAADEALPRTLATPGLATALRHLFAETDTLLVEGSHTLDPERRTLLRRLAREDVAAFGAMLADAGLRLATHRAAPIGATRARGDVLRGDAIVVAIDDVPAVGETNWVVPAVAHGAWARGELLPSPELAFALRRIHRGSRAAEFVDEDAWEVAPGLRMLPVRTPTLPPATHTNTFLVGTGDCVLVEPASPYPDEIDRIVAWVDRARAEGARLRAILVTHHHPDHVGGATALAERLGVPLVGHRATAARLEGRVVFDRLLEDGESIELHGPEALALEALHTPGHAPGHLCFFERRSGALIAGDMVAGVGTILVDTYDGDMALYLESLERMKRLEPSMLLPAHGGVIRSAAAWLDYYVAHRRMREAKILDAIAAVGPATLEELLPTAYDDASPAVWPLARMSIASHVEKLVREGRVVRAGDRVQLA